MTYEEAKRMEREILKDSIRYRLYRYDPVKYAKYKPNNKPISTDRISEIWEMVRIISNHENGDPFEIRDTFFETLKRKIK